MLAIVHSCLLPALFAVSAPGRDVLATYRGGDVTRAEYDSWLLAHGLKDEADRQRAQLEAIALAESLEASAVAAGLDRRPQTAFRLARIETGLLAGALRQAVDRAIVITDAEVEAELKAEEKERFRPRSVLLRNIFKRAPAAEPERARVRDRMEDLRKQLLEGADFADLAWRESESQTRFRDGAMGYVPSGVLDPDVERVAFALRKGELSAVLASAEGFTILRCDDVFEGREIPPDEARNTIRQGLWSRTSLARQAELRAELLAEAAPRYAEAASDDDPAVDFQGGRITRAQLRWLASAPLDRLSEGDRRGLLEEEIVRARAAEKARARGLDRDAVLQARLRWERARLLATAEIARRINESLIPPTDAEMRAHYRANRDRYVSPVRVDVSLIAWPLDPAQIRRQLAEAEALVTRLRAGDVPFDQAAREVSAHPSAPAGGRLGLLTLPELAPLGPNVFRTVEELSPGQTSGPVQQDKRLYVVKLWERQASRPLAFEEAATLVEKELGDARVAALQQEREADARRALAFEMVSRPTPAG